MSALDLIGGYRVTTDPNLPVRPDEWAWSDVPMIRRVFSRSLCGVVITRTHDDDMYVLDGTTLLIQPWQVEVLRLAAQAARIGERLTWCR